MTSLQNQIKDAIEIGGPLSRSEVHENIPGDHTESELESVIDEMVIEGELIFRRDGSLLYLPEMVFPAPSDEKTIPEVYLERNLLAFAFIQTYVDLYELKHNLEPAYGWWDGQENTSMALVWIDTPLGQAAWHVPRFWIPDSIPRRDPEYDGYSDGVKNDRVRVLAGIPKGVVPEFLPNMDPGGALDARDDT